MSGNTEQAIKEAIPDRVWDLYFGPDGQIPQLHSSISQLNARLGETNRRIDKYNNLHSLMEALARQVGEVCTTVKTHERILADHKIRKETEIEILKREKEIAEEAREQEAKRFGKIIKIIGTIIALIGLGITILVTFVL